MGLKEIARMTGLSITTVSHALNGTRAVSQKSMALIRDAVAKTGARSIFPPRMTVTAVIKRRLRRWGLRTTSA